MRPRYPDTRPTLRIATWNCRGAIDKKRQMFESLAADVIVVPECPSDPRIAQELGVSFAWRGQSPSKGLGVFGLNGWAFSPVEAPAELPWLLPLALADPSGGQVATLLAIWTVQRTGAPPYDSQVAMAIDAWRQEIENRGVILAGDFNCSAQTAATTRHRENVDALARLGAESAYHGHTGLAHGEETAMTLRWVGRGSLEHWYHCDFVFLSAELARGVIDVAVGDPADWIGPGRSDHCPVSVDVVVDGLGTPGSC
ncbi:MAG: hypothetical protein AB7O78_02625 [Thermoleophilia bacterium]